MYQDLLSCLPPVTPLPSLKAREKHVALDGGDCEQLCGAELDVSPKKQPARDVGGELLVQI